MFRRYGRILPASIPFSQKLDIVNEQDIDVAVFIAKGFCCIVLDGIDQFIGESLTGCIKDLHFRMVLVNLVAYGIHEVRLAKS